VIDNSPDQKAARAQAERWSKVPNLSIISAVPGLSNARNVRGRAWRKPRASPIWTTTPSLTRLLAALLRIHQRIDPHVSGANVPSGARPRPKCCRPLPGNAYVDWRQPREPRVGEWFVAQHPAGRYPARPPASTRAWGAPLGACEQRESQLLERIRTKH